MGEWKDLDLDLITRADQIRSKHGDVAVRHYLNYEHWRRDLDAETKKSGTNFRFILINCWSRILKWLV